MCLYFSMTTTKLLAGRNTLFLELAYWKFILLLKLEIRQAMFECAFDKKISKNDIRPKSERRFPRFYIRYHRICHVKDNSSDVLFCCINFDSFFSRIRNANVNIFTCKKLQYHKIVCEWFFRLFWILWY